MPSIVTNIGMLLLFILPLLYGIGRALFDYYYKQEYEKHIDKPQENLTPTKDLRAEDSGVSGSISTKPLIETTDRIIDLSTVDNPYKTKYYEEKSMNPVREPEFTSYGGYNMEHMVKKKNILEDYIEKYEQKTKDSYLIRKEDLKKLQQEKLMMELGLNEEQKKIVRELMGYDY